MLETAALLGEQTVGLLLALGERLVTLGQLVVAARAVAFALLEDVVLAVENPFAVADLPLFLLNFFAAPASFGFPGLAELDELFFSGEKGGLAEALGLALRIGRDPPRSFLGGGFAALLALYLTPRAESQSQIKKNRAGNY